MLSLYEVRLTEQPTNVGENSGWQMQHVIFFSVHSVLKTDEPGCLWCCRHFYRNVILNSLWFNEIDVTIDQINSNSWNFIFCFSDFTSFAAPDMCIASAISLLMILICGMATYGAYKVNKMFFCAINSCTQRCLKLCPPQHKRFPNCLKQLWCCFYITVQIFQI